MDSDGHTALYYAVKYKKTGEVIKLLKSKGACLNIFDAISLEDVNEVKQALDRDPKSVNKAISNGETPIFFAIAYKNQEIMKLLISRGARMNDRIGKERWTPIQYAVSKYADTEVIKLMLSEGANVYVSDSEGNSLLSFTMNQNGYEQAKLVYLKGIKIDYRGPDAYRLLCLAAENGDNRIVRLLISRGVNVNSRHYKEYGSTPLFEAVTSGKPETVKTLLKAGANPDLYNRYWGTPMHGIVYYNSEKKLQPEKAYKIADLLIKSGAGTNTRNKDGETPLHNLNRYPEIIELLIKHGADIRGKDNKGALPIHHAAGWGKGESIKIYLDMGIDINVRDSEGRTPLHYAIQEENNKSTLFLIEKGADMDAQDKYGFLTRWEESSGRKWDKENRQKHGDAPIFYAFECKNREMIRTLIERGAKPDITNHVGATPMTLAAAAGYKDILNLLINKRVKIDTENNYPLHRAVNNGHTGSVEILLKNGADVNRKNENGQTPLHIITSCYGTAWINRFDIIDILMKNGAEINKRDAKGNTPLYYAVETGDIKLVDTLLSYGASVHTLCSNGTTPLMFALKSGKYDIAKKMMKRDWTLKGFILAVLVLLLSVFGFMWWKKRKRGK